MGCYEIALEREDCRFTIVLGPNSRLREGAQRAVPRHITLCSYVPRLELLLASCDIAIVHGGYNSLIESVYGGATVIVVANQTEEEQREHAKRLSALADVRVADLGNLRHILAGAISNHMIRPLASPIALDIGGAARISASIREDLAGLRLARED